MKLLAYVFCELRNAVTKGKPGAYTTEEMSRIKFIFSQLFLTHRSACKDKACLCSSREIYLKSIKMYRMDKQLLPEIKWVTEMIFTCQFILDKKLLSLGGDSLELKGDREFTDYFILWSVFSVENYGNTLAILSILSKLLKQDKLEADKQHKPGSKWLSFFSSSWRNNVLKSYLKIVIETQSKFMDSTPWSPVFVNSSCKQTVTRHTHTQTAMPS